MTIMIRSSAGTLRLAIIGDFQPDLSRRAYIDNCFNQVRTIDQARKLPGEISQNQTFRNPFINSDSSFFQHLDDARKLTGTVSAGEERDFPFVKERIIQRNRVARQTDEYR